MTMTSDHKVISVNFYDHVNPARERHFAVFMVIDHLPNFWKRLLNKPQTLYIIQEWRNNDWRVLKEFADKAKAEAYLQRLINF